MTGCYVTLCDTAKKLGGHCVALCVGVGTGRWHSAPRNLDMDEIKGISKGIPAGPNLRCHCRVINRAECPRRFHGDRILGISVWSSQF
jgi:hypothetical protein